MSAVARATRRVRGGSLVRRLGLLLGLAAVVLGALLAGTAVVLVRLADQQELVSGTYFEAISRADSAYVQLVDAETAVRGFAVTGNRTTLEPFARAGEDTFADLATDLAGQDLPADVVGAATRAGEAADAWRRQWAEPLVAQVSERGPASVEPEQIRQGRERFAEVRAVVADAVDLLRTHRAQAVQQLGVLTRLVTALVVVVSSAAVVAGAGAWLLLRRWVLDPIEALARQTRAVSDGDLTRAVAATGPDELRDLADDVEHMRSALAGQVLQLRAARAALAAQAEELRRSNRDLEQFAYVASHDLQEPLRKVASFTQLLSKRYAGRLDEQADQYIAFAVDGAKRMQRLIQDLLEFSRLGRPGGEAGPVPLERALDRALDQLSERVRESGAQVTRDPLPVVRGHEGLLVQLLANLVGNAVKFAAAGRTPQVHVRAEHLPGYWQVEVRDNGIGIDARYAERVFVIFQRLHPKDVYEGTGIGLALCARIVERHGGRIWVEQVTGPGTSVRFTLSDAPPEIPAR